MVKTVDGKPEVTTFKWATSDEVHGSPSKAELSKQKKPASINFIQLDHFMALFRIGNEEPPTEQQIKEVINFYILNTSQNLL